MAINYLLFESPVGFAIFNVRHQADSIGLELPEVKESMKHLDRFGKMVQLRSFTPWNSAAEGLAAINMISEGLVPDTLKNTLEINLPQTSGKKSKVVLGVADPKLAAEINTIFPGIQCETSTTSSEVHEFLRGIRVHQAKLLKGLNDGDVERAALGLGHAYSRAKVKFSVHKNDNHIIQGIATLDALDKGINQGAMRVREWYGWHFPELIRLVSDNNTYAKLVLAIGDKADLTEEKMDQITAIVNDDKDMAEAIVSAAKISMGQEISATDLHMVQSFASNVSQMADYRKLLAGSLDRKMNVVAPNLQTLIGTHVAARLISHAGSLTTLSKYPASTLQILGAEKALFRALKTKSATPKYGLLYQASFIGRAGPKIKGRISRLLANKCSIASRLDNFSEQPTHRFGEVMRDQIEQRLQFYATGAAPMKNTEAMDKALKAVLADAADTMDMDVDGIDHAEPLPKKEKEAKEKGKKEKEGKKEKKEKKDKKRKSTGDVDVEMANVQGDGKQKKHKKRKSLPVEA